jgi:phage portal protein BeeE
METEWATFIKVTLGRYLQSIENGLSRCFPRGSVVSMNTDALLRSETKTRFEIYGMAITSGVMTINEARASENLPPIKEPEPAPAPPAVEKEDQEEAPEDE